MVSFNEIKALCDEHNELLKKNKIINNANEQQIWMEVRDAKGNSFILSDNEIQNLNEYIANEGIALELKVSRMCNIR